MLRIIVDWFVYSVLMLDPQSKWGGVLHFFLYDSVKILLLLFFMMSAIGFLRSFISPGKVKLWLSAKKGVGHFFASLFGAVTPFCSCSSIPIFFGFLSAGVPLGVTLSFLITSPLINEYLVVLMLGFFGFKVTALYVTSGILIGVITGYLLGKLKLEKYLVEDFAAQHSSFGEEVRCEGFRQRFLFGIREAKTIVGKIWLWILIGVGIGALMHNYVPDETVQAVVSKTGFFSVPFAVLLGVPMYGSCAAIVPIAVVLFEKGVPLGTALAFMMAVVTLSLPEAVMLRRAMKLKLIVIFFTATTLAIILTGYLFNLVQ